MSLLGACIGLGNIWRFPFLLQRDGGGAFLIAFMVAILIVGLPLFALESTLGSKLRLSTAKAWEFLTKNKRFQILGFFGVAILLVVVIYYSTIFGWTVRSLIDAFIPSMWRYHSGQILHFAPAKSISTFGDLGSFKWDWFLIIIVVWIVTFLAVLKGIVGAIEKINVYGILLKLILLLILFVYVLTLNGASTGLNYLFEIRWNDLRHISIWSDAFSQVFFSSSLAVGIIFAFSRHAKKNQEINLSAGTIIFTNAFVATLISVLIYSMLGWFYVHFNGDFGEHWNNISDFFNSTQFKDSLSGPGLLFNLIPTTLGALNAQINYLGSFIGICFFAAVIFATFTCFLALIVAMSECIKETYKHIPLWFILILTFIPGFFFNVFLCFQFSSNLISPVDHYVENYFYMIAGSVELFIFCWMVRYDERQIYYDYANNISGISFNKKIYNFILKYITFGVVLFVLIYSIVDDLFLKQPDGTKYYEVLYSQPFEFWYSLIVGVMFPMSELVFLSKFLSKIDNFFNTRKIRQSDIKREFDPLIEKGIFSITPIKYIKNNYLFSSKMSLMQTKRNRLFIPRKVN